MNTLEMRDCAVAKEGLHYRDEWTGWEVTGLWSDRVDFKLRGLEVVLEMIRSWV